jgi:hypothetical protein
LEGGTRCHILDRFHVGKYCWAWGYGPDGRTGALIASHDPVFRTQCSLVKLQPYLYGHGTTRCDRLALRGHPTAVPAASTLRASGSPAAVRPLCAMQVASATMQPTVTVCSKPCCRLSTSRAWVRSGAGETRGGGDKGGGEGFGPLGLSLFLGSNCGPFDMNE